MVAVPSPDGPASPTLGVLLGAVILVAGTAPTSTLVSGAPGTAEPAPSGDLQPAPSAADDPAGTTGEPDDRTPSADRPTRDPSDGLDVGADAAGNESVANGTLELPPSNLTPDANRTEAADDLAHWTEKPHNLTLFGRSRAFPNTTLRYHGTFFVEDPRDPDPPPNATPEDRAEADKLAGIPGQVIELVDRRTGEVRARTVTDEAGDYNVTIRTTGYGARDLQAMAAPGRAGETTSEPLPLRVVGQPADVDLGSQTTCVRTERGNVDCYGDLERFYDGGDALQVSAAYDHACILADAGTVDCFGTEGASNDFVAANDDVDREEGDAVQVSTSPFYTCVTTEGGDVDCWGDSTAGADRDRSDLDAEAVAAGQYHKCILLSSGNVTCDGLNDTGQAEGYSGGDAAAVDVGGRHTCLLKDGGNATCYGSDRYDQLVQRHRGDVVAVAAEDLATCLLLSDGTTRCAGDPFHTSTLDYTGGDAVDVAVSGDHTCARLETGRIHCWGWNQLGQALDYPHEIVPPDHRISHDTDQRPGNATG